MRLLGGGALLFDEFGKLKYHIRNNVLEPKRQGRRLKHLVESGYFDQPRFGAERLCAAAPQRHAARPTRVQKGAAYVAMTPPHELTLRCYGVGFGDCFLLTFRYKGTTGDRHMLIDFGCTQKPPKAGKNLMNAIAKDITTVVGSKLHAVVATHRHTDHISGFATNAKGDAPGDVIGALKPDLVIQPWTEKLSAPIDSKGPKKGLALAANDALRIALQRMQDVAAMSLTEAQHLPALLKNEVKFIGADFVGEKGVKNLSAVQQLAKMGKKGKAAYVQYRQQDPDAQDTVSRREVRRAGASDDFAEKGRRRSESAERG